MGLGSIYGTKKFGRVSLRALIVSKYRISADPQVQREQLYRAVFRRSTGSFFAITCLVFLGIGAVGMHAKAYTPESPKVKKLLDRALDFVDKSATHNRLGGKSLIGLALIKGNRPYDHPKIKHAVEACQNAAATLESKHSADTIYDLGLAIIFLCELDADQYRSEITSLMQLLLKWQKEFGGWGYLEGAHMRTGDTSMTQYAVLASWTADRTGAFPANADSASAVCNWLLRTQDTSGGWGYQGIDPGNSQRVRQFGVQHSLSAAGCGSTYVVADLLRLETGISSRKAGNDGLPPALRIVRKKDVRPSKGPLTTKVNRSRLKETLQRGDTWFEQNYRINASDWVYYYMYALERYKSFREFATGREEREPQWYNDGVEYLASEQAANGAWDSDNGPDIDTCFGILFLVRGTQKSIQKAAAFDGRLRGGRGLPTNSTNVTIGDDGQIVKTPFQGKAASLLAILESAGDEDLDALDRDFEIQLSSDPIMRQRELERLRRLIAADEFAVRLAAVKALYAVRSLDDVPAFIFALGDPDPRVIAKSREALRLLSRRIDGMGLPDDPTEPQKLDAIQQWKEWYLAIRPDAQFLN